MPNKITLNWPVIASVIAALAGAVGTILTPLYGSSLSTAVQAVLQALSGLLLVLPVHQAAATAAARSKATYADHLSRDAVVWRADFNDQQAAAHALTHTATLTPPPAAAGPAPIAVPGGQA